MNDALIVSMLSVVPKNPTARLIGASTRLRLPAAFKRALVRWFVGKYGVDMSEAEGTIDDYPSLSKFFIRPLKPGVRPVDPDPDILTSPVDAVVHTIGRIEEGTFVQTVGQRCATARLVGVGDPRAPGADPNEAARFEGGHFAVLYLSPKDYHRVHTPCDCDVAGYRYLPGQLWPVFAAATRKVPDLFARNERLVFHLDTHFGRVCQVLVGAFGVGRMTSHVADITTNTGGQGEDTRLQPPVQLKKADEIGRFELGSTVILLLEPGQIEWTVKVGDPVRLGRPIARKIADEAVADEAADS